MKISSITYGSVDKSIDIFEKLRSICVDDNIIIPTYLDLNKLFGDPHPFQKKKIFIKLDDLQIKYNIELEESDCFLIKEFNLNNEIKNIFSQQLTDIIPDLSSMFDKKYGLEIGGPSGIIHSMGIYNLSKMDCVNFSTNTIWTEQHENLPFISYNNRILGLNYIREATDLINFENQKYDFLVASHVLEHIANPLKAIKEWKRVIKENGIIVLVLPWKNATFDHNRQITTFDDLSQHYENNTTEYDLTHLDEIIKYHDLSMDLPAGNLEQFVNRSKNNYQNRALHHHVFDFELIVKCLRYFNFDILNTILVSPFHQIVIGKLLNDQILLD